MLAAYAPHLWVEFVLGFLSLVPPCWPSPPPQSHTLPVRVSEKLRDKSDGMNAVLKHAVVNMWAFMIKSSTTSMSAVPVMRSFKQVDEKLTHGKLSRLYHSSAARAPVCQYRRNIFVYLHCSVLSIKCAVSCFTKPRLSNQSYCRRLQDKPRDGLLCIGTSELEAKQKGTAPNDRHICQEDVDQVL
jgi:hypothetical protein